MLNSVLFLLIGMEAMLIGLNVTTATADGITIDLGRFERQNFCGTDTFATEVRCQTASDRDNLCCRRVLNRAAGIDAAGLLEADLPGTSCRRRRPAAKALGHRHCIGWAANSTR